MGVVTGPDSNRNQEFTRLVEQNQTSLRRMCYAILRDEELAKDAVQETFLKAYQGMDAYRGECGEKTWLMRIALNTCRDVQRSSWFRRVDRKVTPENLPEPACPPDSGHVELTLAVMRLPPKLREATLLYYYQDMNMRETGDALGISTSSVCKRLDRAHRKLRALLEGRERDG